MRWLSSVLRRREADAVADEHLDQRETNQVTTLAEEIAHFRATFTDVRPKAVRTADPATRTTAGAPSAGSHPPLFQTSARLAANRQVGAQGKT